MARKMKTYCKVIPISETGDDDYGWYTKPGNPLKYVQVASRYMMMDSVQFMKDLVCENPLMDPKNRRDVTVKKFKEQLYKLKPIQSKQMDPLTIPRVGVSGKVNNEGKVSSMFNDDLAMSFSMGMYLFDLFLERRIPGIDYHGIDESR